MWNARTQNCDVCDVCCVCLFLFMENVRQKPSGLKRIFISRGEAGYSPQDLDQSNIIYIRARWMRTPVLFAIPSLPRPNDIRLNKYLMIISGDTVSLTKNCLNKTLIKSFRLTEVHFAIIEEECRRRHIGFSDFVREATLAAVRQAENTLTNCDRVSCSSNAKSGDRRSPASKWVRSSSQADI